MAFDLIAKSLLLQSANPIPPPNTGAKSNKIAELEAAGWSKADLLGEYRTLYDNTEEDSIKKQILADISKIHGLMSEEERTRELPPIVINIQGDNVRVNAMLCPPISGEMLRTGTDG